MLQLMEEHDAMTDEITELCDQFVSDVKQRIKQLDTQYLHERHKNVFATYLNTIHTTDPETSATASLLNTHINRKTPKVAGTRNNIICVQPTALTRRVSIAKVT